MLLSSMPVLLSIVAVAQDDSAARLKKDLAALAGQEMAGRGNGQEGLGKAVKYLLDTYKKMGLNPRKQPFTLQSARVQNSNEPEIQLNNVIVVIKGSDPDLCNEYIVIGAHLDHLGTRPGQGGAKPTIFYGADDNGSGSVALIELVRHFHKNPPARSLVFIHFSGEEWGLLGSGHWVANPTIDIKSVRFMVNMDMIGRFDNEKAVLTFTAMGMGAKDIERAKELAPEGVTIEADRGTSVFAQASDHAPFASKGIPTCFLFTGIHPDYHKATDNIEKINFGGLATIAKFAISLVTEYATSAEVPKFQPVGDLGIFFIASKESNTVAFVRPNGAASSAGLKSGDVLTHINEYTIETPKDYRAALDNSNRGDKVKIKWLRGDVAMEADVVLK
jgi:Zn-dependent M28 family amino/carboxypeptidase